MKSLFEELGDTYALSKDEMYFPILMINDTNRRSIGRWSRMHDSSSEAVHPGLYERLILNGTLHTHLADMKESECHDGTSGRDAGTGRYRGTAESGTAYVTGWQDEWYPQSGGRDYQGKGYTRHINVTAVRPTARIDSGFFSVILQIRARILYKKGYRNR